MSQFEPVFIVTRLDPVSMRGTEVVGAFRSEQVARLIRLCVGGTVHPTYLDYVGREHRMMIRDMGLEFPPGT
jgi:hypothetical protein